LTCTRSGLVARCTWLACTGRVNPD